MSENVLRKYGWIGLWLSLLLTALYCRPVLPIDETRYLSVAWEMWRNHQFLVPHINGVPYSHKPPLLFWLIQAGWSIFGVNQWTARITGPLFGFFVILLSVRLARVLWPNQHQLHTGLPYLLLGTCFWAFYGTLTLFDMMIACFALIAWLGLRRVEAGGTGSGWLLYGLATGLGLLAKGPVILVYILPPALLAPWWTEKGRIPWSGWYGGLAAAVTVGVLMALAWAIPAARAGGEEYGQAILFGQTAGRIVHSFAHQRPWYWYLLLLPILLFPWSFLPPIWKGSRRLRLTLENRFCLSILVPAFVLLSAISGKQVHYLLPLLPPLFLLLGGSGDFENVSKPYTLFLLPLLLIVLSFALLTAQRLHLDGGDWALLRLVPPSLGFGLLIFAVFLVLAIRRKGPLVIKTSAIFVGLLIFFHLALAIALHRNYDMQNLAREIRTAQDSGRQVAVYPARLSDQFQFAGLLVKPLVPRRSLEEAVLWSQQNQGQAVLLFLDKEKESFFSPGGIAQPYKNGWLVFRSTDGVFTGYGNWIQHIRSGGTE